MGKELFFGKELQLRPEPEGMPLKTDIRHGCADGHKNNNINVLQAEIRQKSLICRLRHPILISGSEQRRLHWWGYHPGRIPFFQILSMGNAFLFWEMKI